MQPAKPGWLLGLHWRYHSFRRTHEAPEPQKHQLPLKQPAGGVRQAGGASPACAPREQHQTLWPRPDPAQPHQRTRGAGLAGSSSVLAAALVPQCQGARGGARGLIRGALIVPGVEAPAAVAGGALVPARRRGHSTAHRLGTGAVAVINAVQSAHSQPAQQQKRRQQWRQHLGEGPSTQNDDAQLPPIPPHWSQAPSTTPPPLGEHCQCHSFTRWHTLPSPQAWPGNGPSTQAP